jgi:AraC-like DNA-binding protein
MLRVRRLAESVLVAIDRVDHPAHLPHVDPAEEISDQYSINWLERGSFSVVYRAQMSRVGSTELFVTVPGQVHRYIHDHDETTPTDSCIAVSFRDGAHDDVAAQFAAVHRRSAVTQITNRHVYLQTRVLDHLAHAPDPIALDLLAAELLDSVLNVERRRLYRPAQLSWYARRIEAARRLLDEDFAAAHTLTGLARNAGMSPFHFARVFRELVGVPPHRYLVRRRLAAAEAMLRGGASVTETCFAVGFQSLSHFVHAFRRTFGSPPSTFVHRSK